MMLIRELLRRRGHRVTEVTTGNDAVQGDGRTAASTFCSPTSTCPAWTASRRRAPSAPTKRADGRARTPIVALTADALEDGKRACQEAGMDGFLTKPVDPAELEEMFLMLFPREEGSHIVAA